MSERNPRYALVEANFAAVAGQLQLSGDSPGRLLIDSREILGSTTRMLAGEVGELGIDIWIALSRLFADQGAPSDDRAEATKRSLARLLYNRNELGGKNLALVTRALFSLYRAEVQFEAYDAATKRYQLKMTRMLQELEFDEQIRLFHADHARYDPAIMGQTWEGTVKVKFGEWHASQIRNGYWVELDWDKLRALGGLSKTLWLLLSSPRMPFRPLLDDSSVEGLIVPLDGDAYLALGINRARERDRKRALEQAGKRILGVDTAYRECAPARRHRLRHPDDEHQGRGPTLRHALARARRARLAYYRQTNPPTGA